MYTCRAAMVKACTDGSMWRFFGELAKTGSERVQIDVSAGSQQSLFIKDRDRFVATLPKRAGNSFGTVYQTRQRFFEALHEPTQIGESFSRVGNIFSIFVGQLLFDPLPSDFKRFTVLATRWKQHCPTAYDLFIGPLFDAFGFQPHYQMEVVV